MRRLAKDLGFPIDLAHSAGNEFGHQLAVHIEAHLRAAEILRIEFTCAMEPALLAHGEQQGYRRVRQLLFQQRLDKDTNTAHPVRLSPPSAVVPSETIRLPSILGFAPAQSGTVSRCVAKSRRGPDRVPGRSA